MPRKILVIRFSAMGDVALCSPVISAVLNQYEDVEITMLTRNFFTPLFAPHPRLKFVDVDLKRDHKGILGLRRLYNQLKKERFDTVIDLHDVLRSKIIRRFFGFSINYHARTFVIDKGRKEKEAIVTKKNTLRLLPHTTERYLTVFNQAGLPAQLDKTFRLPVESFTHFLDKHATSGKDYFIIAPFAAHQSKEWGDSRWIEFLEQFYAAELSQLYTVVLLGGGAGEKEKLDTWNKKFPHAVNITGIYSLAEELSIMAGAKLVIAMDSGNMHLASLVGTRVIQYGELPTLF
jgi:ADP-heptose:LPS heptosyltransferase